MKRIIFISALVLSALVSQSQSYNPFLNQGIVSPAPLLPYEFNGVGTLSFNVGNTGSTPLALVVGDEMILVVELKNGLPDNANPLDALGGPWLGYFDWSYDVVLNTFYGTQNQQIPGSSLGGITIAYKVTVNTPLTVALNGFKATLLPPSYTNGFNSTDDDLVSSYTFVRATDYGDAPISYGAAGAEINLFKGSDGNYINYMFLGDTIDHEFVHLFSDEADGDDLDNVDDEDGVTFPVMIKGTTVTIPVVATVRGGFGFLNAWIDWNGDGDFVDAGEQIASLLTVFSSQTINLVVNIPADAVSGNTFARFRFGANIGPTGFATYGEVEDYMIDIIASEPAIDIVKTATPQIYSNVGELITYSFTVSNTGNVTLTNVSVSDPLPGLSAITPGPVTLTPGQSQLFTATYMVTQADIDALSIFNMATATGTPPTGPNVTDIDSETITTDSGAALSLAKIAIPLTYSTAGELITYNFTVTNTENVTLTNVSVSDPLPGLSAITPGPVTLAPGQSQLFTATYMVTQADIDAGSVLNTATATGTPTTGPNVTDTDDEIITANQDPQIELLKSGVWNDLNSDGYAQAGETITYSFTVTNTGNVTVSGLEIDDARLGVVGLVVTPSTLAPGESGTASYTYTITQSDVDDGGVYNIALATGEDPNGGIVEDESEDPTPLDPDDPNYDPDCPDCTYTDLPQDPQIELLKSGVWNDLNSDGYAQAGETITYSFTVTNTGNVTVSGLEIDDARLGVVGLVVTPSTLAPGESGTASYTYTVTQSDVDDGGVYNIALATGEDPNGGIVEDESEDPTPLDPDDPNYDPDCPDCTFTELPNFTSVGSFVWHDINGNGIQDPGEPGIPNVQVQLFSCAAGSGISPQYTTTDANGYYLFDQVIPGSYYVKFILPGDFEFTFPLQGSDPSVDSDVTGAKGFGTTGCFAVLAGEERLDIDAGAYICVDVGQTVWLDYNMNDIFDAGENGINGIRVRLFKWHNNSWVLWDYVFTGINPNPEPFCDDGYYHFCTSPGLYYVQFVMPPQGLVPARPNIGSNPDIDSDITREYGTGTTDDFILVSGTAGIMNLDAGFYDQAMIIQSLVWIDENANGIRESGEPGVANVEVEIYDIAGDLRSTTLTDQNGGYDLTYLQADDYYIKFKLPADVGSSYGFTVPYQGSPQYDSDVTNTFGYGTTAMISLDPGDEQKFIDAGLATGSLPLNFISLGAKWVSDHADVYWTTANERDAMKYIVQRSYETADNFEAIGEVMAKNSNTNSYLFEDWTEFRSGIYYYRLIQVDNDGLTSTSRIVAIFVSMDSSKDDYIVYPNPTYGMSNVRMILTDQSDIRMDLFDMNGQKVISDIVRDTFGIGIYDISYSVNELRPATYLLRIINGDSIEFKEIIVVR